MTPLLGIKRATPHVVSKRSKHVGSRETIMTQALKLISPLDAEYAEHRQAAERRRETREWLEHRERELGFVKDAPSVAPKAPQR
jgi:hypothetical protein